VTEIAIRLYAERDFDVVTSIWYRSWQSAHVPAKVTLEDLRERWPWELANGWTVYVATLRGRIVGFLARREDILEQLFIAPDSQRQGIGKQLLDFAKAQMPGGFSLRTAVQGQAGRFYEREGLHRGEVASHPKLDHQIVGYTWRPATAGPLP